MDHIWEHALLTKFLLLSDNEFSLTLLSGKYSLCVVYTEFIYNIQISFDRAAFMYALLFLRIICKCGRFFRFFTSLKWICFRKEYYKYEVITLKVKKSNKSQGI